MRRRQSGEEDRLCGSQGVPVHSEVRFRLSYTAKAGITRVAHRLLADSPENGPHKSPRIKNLALKNIQLGITTCC